MIGRPCNPLHEFLFQIIGNGPKKGEATSTSRAQVDTSTVDNVKSVQQGVNKAGLGLTKKKCPATKSSTLQVHDCPSLKTMLELMGENEDHVDIDEPGQSVAKIFYTQPGL